MYGSYIPIYKSLLRVDKLLLDTSVQYAGKGTLIIAFDVHASLNCELTYTHSFSARLITALKFYTATTFGTHSCGSTQMMALVMTFDIVKCS